MSITTKRTWTRGSLFLIFAFGASMTGGDCDGDIVDDPTFRDWCGASLCAWKLDAGKVARVPTWNEYDLGVSFVDTPTQISQATDDSGASCVLFTSVADIDPAADVVLSVDFNSDGSFESTTTLGATSWQRVQTEITAPAAYQGITFVLRKAGSGKAILAEMRIQSTTGCTAPAAPIQAASLAFGETCAQSSDCAKGLTCTGTSGDTICSQCSDAAPCAGGAACSTRSVFFPSQCGPGMMLGKAGDPCLASSDCASGSCLGAEPVPLAGDAGACDLNGELGASDPQNCKWFAARGGQCQ